VIESAGGGSFSSMSASYLLRWVRSEATESLGSEPNRWLRLIEVASKNAMRNRNPDERAIFREAALLALEKAQQAGALSPFESVRRTLSLRARYMRQGNFDQEWLRQEASSLFDLLSDSIPIDISAASRLVELRRDRESWIAAEPEVRNSLDQAVELLKPVSHIVYYLEARDRAMIEPWLGLMSKYMMKK